ncbi:class I SAM-dependent RNA methyltransferase [Aeromicrobium sp. 50.2.37]|uniref:class I SAM-dependent RNA methyltransferase n=1 Tax=Aeromicrobium sp. 50.2.37 TaxID=2969305 RepID=UPI00214F9915|nr:TRAM domain-containing protein [Aeromicrobium sp. 50.2.37]MCR4511843.1 TRAM domain-containing protein [Aeromicrobium sp. 50.2.37]
MTSEVLPVVEVGPVAHGGSCVARLDGQVVFVRHALPGERVSIRVTDRTKRYLRADAVEVLEASPDRVTPPCDLAGVCGGCDFQHVDPDAQLRLLGSVVSEQLQRLAGIEREVHVEAVSPSLGWRTRVTWSTTPDGRAGLRRHRSHEVVPVEHCPIAHPGLPDVLSHRWDAPQVEAIVSSKDQQLLVTDATVPKGLRVDGVAGTDGARRAGRTRLTERVEDHDFTVTGSGFWQVHPAAARTLVDAVLEAAEARPGDRVADLYAGVGLFTAFLADRVGPEGTVVSVEADTQAARDARRSLHRHAQVRLVSATTEQALRHDDELRRGVDLVVLDPPRTGARRAVPDVAGLGARRIVYVACDPAALARDVATFAEHGYRLGSLRAFALFPMTHHVECVAVLDRQGSDSE